ncbi:MAG: methylated-DNA--[protein]-cysteine S-methyltransferase [Flavobacteriaceae bacterium]|jgi:methylated-DNA-[protein]-cysteine S-methyltransferase|nr:methylated-DNA--[protein]-cysteine S-methyltransferase [Flavobacteriaceae bacterium]
MAQKNIIFIQYYKTSIGELIVGSFENQLCLLDFRYRKMREAIDKRLQTGLNAIYFEKETPLLRTVRLEIQAYLKGDRNQFSLAIKMVGSPFQLSVWNALLTIPYGTTISYLELAHQIGNKKAIRAVASANGANAIALIIPCHRVIGATNKLVGYAGGLSIKKRLLKLELAYSQNPEELPFWDSE